MGYQTNEKHLDKAIEQAYYKIASGQQIGIMDIPQVFALARKNVAEKGIVTVETVEQGVRAAVLLYCEDANKGLEAR